jgi:hypothetical protein
MAESGKRYHNGTVRAARGPLALAAVVSTLGSAVLVTRVAAVGRPASASGEVAGRVEGTLRAMD